MFKTVSQSERGGKSLVDVVCWLFLGASLARRLLGPLAELLHLDMGKGFIVLMVKSLVAASSTGVARELLTCLLPLVVGGGIGTTISL